MTSIFRSIKPKENKFKCFLKVIRKGTKAFYNFFSPTKLRKEKQPRKLNIAVASILALIGIFTVYRFSVYSYGFIKNFEIKDIVFMMGDEVKQDENGFTNFLLLGRGGEGHDGPELTDTIIIASLDHATQSVVMLSVPRDFYIRTEYYGSSRINEIVRNVKNRLTYQNKLTEEEAFREAMGVLKNKVEEIVELDLHYYAMIDFRGFKSIVDALGGIDVTVEQDIRDTTYPADTGWGFQVFEIKTGEHHLDGSTALKYARSRHTTSDFDRAKRQQKVIQAIKNKALELDTLTSPTKLKNLYASVESNVKTNLTFGEIITLAKFASETPRENIVSKVLVDEWSFEGGFLATPPRDQYGGAFVLIPYIGDLSEIHRYTRLLYQNRGVLLENAKIEVQNGTYLGGIAGKVGTKLWRYSWNVTSITNTNNRAKYAKSKIIINDPSAFPVTKQVLPEWIDAELVLGSGSTLQDNTVNALEKRILETESHNTTEEENTTQEKQPDIVIILGEDYQKATQKL